MMASKKNATVFAQGLKIAGAITADGLVEVNGEIDGPMNCSSVIVGQTGRVRGSITGQRVTVDGAVEGPIFGGEVTLKSCAYVVGDIECHSVLVEKGAFVEGRLIRAQDEIEKLPSEATLATAGLVQSDLTQPSLPIWQRDAQALLDGKELLFASLIGLTLIGLLTWFIAG
jgi:cytoskeletal protein CcmA (bactofilin family)